MSIKRIVQQGMPGSGGSPPAAVALPVSCGGVYSLYARCLPASERLLLNVLATEAIAWAQERPSLLPPDSKELNLVVHPCPYGWLVRRPYKEMAEDEEPANRRQLFPVLSSVMTWLSPFPEKKGRERERNRAYCDTLFELVNFTAPPRDSLIFSNYRNDTVIHQGQLELACPGTGLPVNRQSRHRVTTSQLLDLLNCRRHVMAMAPENDIAQAGYAKMVITAVYAAMGYILTLRKSLEAAMRKRGETFTFDGRIDEKDALFFVSGHHRTKSIDV